MREVSARRGVDTEPSYTTDGREASTLDTVVTAVM
jgi:hypothetical protein